MDAKVLRAAVSAAIRVTISTTLIGCGGSVVGEASEAGGTPSSSSTGGAPPNAMSGGADEHVSAPQVPSGTGATGGGGAQASSASVTAGTATSIDVGGMVSTDGGASEIGGASQAGEASSGGATAEECGAAVAACLTQVEPEVPSAALSDAGKACCETIIAGFDELRLAGAACFTDLDRRFMTSGVRQRCCADQATWTHLACTPWGPPVPPELPAAALQAWGLVA